MIRLPLKASIMFWWKDESGKHRQSTGRTRDVSERGVFVVTASHPHIGATIGLRMFLDAAFDAMALRIEIEGLVLRVERSRIKRRSGGFAVLSRQIILADSRQNLARGPVGAKDELIQ